MYEIYTIQNGDTIETIANKYNTSPTLLYQINGISENNMLTPGMTIVVPKRSDNYFNYYTVAKGDNLYQIAKNNNVDYKLLAALNGLNVNDYIYPNQTIMIPKKEVSLYITKEGDTLSSVTKSLNANLEAIINQNRRIYLLPEQLIVYKKK
jgi:LysM repeat protein